MSTKLNKLLIANRGEIAIRVQRTATEMGLKTVTVFTDDDRNSLHAQVADQSFQLKGTGAAAYLDIDRIIRVSQENECDAIHPGYGFLSENADFAEACIKSGITFVGPSPHAQRLMGDKLQAHSLADANQISVLPASGVLTSTSEAIEFIRSNESNPVILKAVTGGGGRGMRIVHHVDEVSSALERGSAEARAAFGSGALYAEMLIEHALHIEVQILGDNHGEISHLGERDCIIQRRHQKIVEVAPSPQLPPSLRERILADAVKLANAAKYNNLGTFEFLVNGENLNDNSDYYFIEANPRLQVEHTVTEEVTGVDLVRTQIEIAEGKSLAELGLNSSNAPESRGFAIQLRVNMETLQPDGVALPKAGTLTSFLPPVGPGVRIDTFGYEGYSTSSLYDSLLAKLIVHNGQPNLNSVVKRAASALGEFVIVGVDTNLGTLMNMMALESISDGRMYTRFIDDNLASLLKERRLATKPSSSDRKIELAGAQVDARDPLAVLSKGRQQRQELLAQALPQDEYPEGMALLYVPPCNRPSS